MKKTNRIKNNYNELLYKRVKIKASGLTGTIVAFDDDGGTKAPIFFIEKDDIYKTGSDDLIWIEQNDIEFI